MDSSWFEIGQDDAIRGKPRQSADALRESCPGIRPDFAAYDDGWINGISTYCTPRNGLRVGSAGKRYLRICPQPDAAFRKAFDVGAGLYQIKRSLTNLRLLRESTRAELRSDRLTPSQRAELNRRLSYFEGTIATLKLQESTLERRASLIRAEASNPL